MILEELKVTKKKLNGIYFALSRLGFSREDIEVGMRATVGRTLAATLDWMCFNVPHERLPG